MKSASRIVSVATITVLILFLLSCGGSGTTGSPAPIGDTYTAISGVAQKGPLQLGSLVTLQEMDKDLSPTGTQYTYQINSNLGTFSPTNKYSKKYIDIFATGYYFDEVTNRISTGPINLNGISDLSEHQILNVNLLTTLAYQRVQMLVNNYGLSISAARTQAENEVLAALNIPNGSEYGAFDSLDLAKGRAGDYILAAISSIFAVGNNAGDLSSLIANFQFDIAETGVITDTALKNALAISAKTINLSEVATNLNSKYARSGITYTAADLSNWVDQDGDGVVGEFNYQVTNASDTSTFTFPASAVDQLVGLPVTVSVGQLKINGSTTTGAVIINQGDTVVVKPSNGEFPAGVLTIYLKTGTTNLARVDFIKEIISIEVTPINPNISKGFTKKFIATGKFTDGSTEDVSNSVTWSSGNASIATISAVGLASSISVGTTNVTAKLGAISGSTSLNITMAILQSISIKPTTPYTGIGLTELLIAEGTYSDSTTNDITSRVTWSSENIDVATINATTGLVTGIDLGTSLITATLDTITGFSTFAVISNPWTSVGSMSILRSGHTATLLSNGNVLVAGGYNNGGGRLASAELYDPETNSWNHAGSMNTARYFHTATLLPNGKVLVTGGHSEDIGVGDHTDSTELYDPVTNTWSAAESLITPRFRHTATLLPNGKVLVVGGDNDYGNQLDSVSASAEIYDPTTDNWSAAGDLSTKHVEHTATLLTNGKVLVAGGCYTSPDYQSLYVDSSELYDPATNSWTIVGSLITARHNHVATLLANGMVLVSGGYNYYNGGQLATAELYDPATNNWSNTGSLNTARRLGHTATLLTSGKVLVIGGYSSNTGILDSVYYLSSAELYNPATNTWSDAGDLSTVRSRHTAMLLANGKVLVAGGSELNTAELSWTW